MATGLARRLIGRTARDAIGCDRILLPSLKIARVVGVKSPLHYGCGTHDRNVCSAPMIESGSE